MTVQELIDGLMKVEDKLKEVFVGLPCREIEEVKEYENDVTIWGRTNYGT